jgi:hypothetical protein
LDCLSSAEKGGNVGVRGLSDEQIRKTLASFAAEETKILTRIAYYETNGPIRMHTFFKRHYARMHRQIEVRRRWLKSLLPAD